MTDEAFDRPKEECGVIGLYAPGREAARLAFFSLFALQHRGQESTGIATSDGVRVRMHRDQGLVSNVFNEKILGSLKGHMAVGHNRYSTTGPSVLRNVQPVYCQSLEGDIAVAHNGNLVNAKSLRKEMEAEGEHFDSSSDSELIARLLVRNLSKGIELALGEVMRRAKGAYSCTVLTPTQVIGFRDPYGIRPLLTGRLDDGGWVIVSESCALTPIDAAIERELNPGEAAIIDSSGARYVQIVEPAAHAMCMFEFIYFARPDSVMYGSLLYTARERMGAQLAIEQPAPGADIVVPVPDSGIPAALGFAAESGIPFCEGMIKSRYIHRTFILPDPHLREMGVRMKLSVLREHIQGKSVVLVDDSIVRATTTGQIVRLLKSFGAREVHVRITAPPIAWPCFYGIDMANRDELAAAKWTIEQIKEHVEADSLGYLSVPGVVKAVGRPEDTFCLACFTGKYPLEVEDFERDPFGDPVGTMASVLVGQGSLFD